MYQRRLSDLKKQVESVSSNAIILQLVAAGYADSLAANENPKFADFLAVCPPDAKKALPTQCYHNIRWQGIAITMGLD